MSVAFPDSSFFWVIAFENLLKAILGVGAAFGLFAHSLDQADRMIFVQRVVPGVLVGVVVFIIAHPALHSGRSGGRRL